MDADAERACAVRSARTPLGLWEYDPRSGLNVLDTDGPRGSWRPLVVSLALTSRCRKGCGFCYAAAGPEGSTAWGYADLMRFVLDLDREGVFSVTLGGGEPLVWRDPAAGKGFYDLINDLAGRVSLDLTFTTGGVPEPEVDRLPNIPVRLSCHRPEELEYVLRCAERLRRRLDHVGINFLLWRSRLPECRDAIHRLAAAGFDDILLLAMQPTGRGAAFAHERVAGPDLHAFLRTLGLECVRLAACEAPGALPGADMGCGANDWFVSVDEHRRVRACSFAPEGRALAEPTYQALLEASRGLPRPPCYRPYLKSPLAHLSRGTPIQAEIPGTGRVGDGSGSATHAFLTGEQ